MTSCRPISTPVAASAPPKAGPSGAVQSRLLGYLQQEFRWRGGRKRLACLAGCQPCTSKRWLLGQREPGGVHVERLLMHPRFREGYLAWLDRAA